MADVPLEVIDVTTPYPNGEYGEPFKEAFEKVNRNFATTEGQLGRIDTVVAEVEGVKQEVVQMGEDLRAEVDGKIEQIDQQVTAALEDVDTRVNAAIVEIDGKVAQLEQDIPGMVSAEINGRIPGKNRIINGNFDIYQRGNPGTITNTAAYTADRWICSSAGAGATSNWGLGATTPGEIPDSRMFLGFNVVAGVSSAWVGQWIESVRTFAGGKATVSFWMRSGVAGKKVGLLIQQHFGSGGSPMVQVVAPEVITLTTTFTKYSVTFDVPSIAGKTVGGAGNALLLTFFYADDRPSLFGGQLVGQTGLFELAQVQMEKGDKATDFEWRPVGHELQLCQRYYSKSYALATKAGTPNSDSGRIATGIQIGGTNAPSFTAYALRFPVAMRVAPAVTVYGAVSGNPNKVTMSDNADTSGVPTVRGLSEGGCEINWVNNAGTFGGWFHFTADAEL